MHTGTHAEMSLSGLVRHVVGIRMEAARLRKYLLVVSICTVYASAFVVYVVYYALHTHLG